MSPRQRAELALFIAACAIGALVGMLLGVALLTLWINWYG